MVPFLSPEDRGNLSGSESSASDDLNQTSYSSQSTNNNGSPYRPNDGEEVCIGYSDILSTDRAIICDDNGSKESSSYTVVRMYEEGSGIAQNTQHPTVFTMRLSSTSRNIESPLYFFSL